MRFRLTEDVPGVYVQLEAGYSDSLEYPNIYYESTGELLICEGHGEYTRVNRSQYEIIEDKALPKSIDLLQYECANDHVINLVSFFGSPKWVARYLAWKIERKYKKYLKRLKWSKIVKDIEKAQK